MSLQMDLKKLRMHSTERETNVEIHGRRQVIGSTEWKGLTCRSNQILKKKGENVQRK